MPRLLTTSVFRVQPAHSFVSTRRFLSSSTVNMAGDQNSKPGWEGRPADDHVVNRPTHDAQAEASHSGMKQKEQGKEGSGAISEKDERNSNQKAKDEFPESPGPIIGMNSERGSKGN